MTTFFIDPEGSDGAIGDRDHPFKTIGHGLSVEGAQRLVVNPGRYVEDLRVPRSIEIYGPGGSGAVVEGSVEITGSGVRLHGVDVSGGLKVTGAKSLVLEDGVYAPGSADDGLLIVGSSGRLERIEARGGPETCISAKGSTLTLSDIVLRATREPEQPPKRGLRAETSSVTVRRISGSGASIGLVAAQASSHFTITDADLGPSLGVGLSLTGHVVALALRIKIHETRSGGVLVGEAEAELRGFEINRIPLPSSALGVAGGTARAYDGLIESVGGHSVSMNALRGRQSEVALERVEIRHGALTGVSAEDSKLSLKSCRLVGAPEATTDGNDAIVIRGNGARALIEATDLEYAAGHGLSITNDAGGRISARIVRPRLSGVYISETAGQDLELIDLSVSEAQGESGIYVEHSQDVSLRRVEVSRSPGSGVLAALGSKISISASRVLASRQYGVAAFGGSEVELAGSTVRGGKWATFASCADGSFVQDLGGNSFEGPVTTCP